MPRRSLVPSLTLLAAVAAFASDAAAQGAERYGRWRLQSDAPPPSLNIMTYEPYMDGGMRITVEATNSRGETTTWGYVTLFDGVFRPVTGREGSETAVEAVDGRTTKITSRRDGRITQVIFNRLSEDGNRIDNEYHNYNEDGTVRNVTTAVYERIR